jgi:hypothetical protein
MAAARTSNHAFIAFSSNSQASQMRGPRFLFLL